MYGYLGIDLDSNNRYQLYKAYYNARYMFPDKKIEVYRSASGRGFHIKIMDFTGSFEEDLMFRRMFGDCVGRLICSELSKRDFLARWKKKSGKWVERELFSIESEPMW